MNDYRAEDLAAPTVQPTPGFKRTLVTIVLIALGLILATAFAYTSFDRLVERTVTRLEAVSTVLIETTEAHLWFEEILSGDDNEDISVVWFHLDRARISARALLDGGVIPAGRVAPLKDDLYRQKVDEILALLVEVRTLAHQRYEHALSSRPGSEIDEQFDYVFDRLIAEAKILDLALREESRRDLLTSKVMHLVLVLLFLGLTATLISVMRRYERNQTASAAILVKKEGQLRQAQKMEAVGNLAGGIAHDFNNLLQAIIGYGEVLAEDLAGGDKGVEEVDHILKAGHRASDLTRQLLAYSRRQAISPVDLDLNELITNVMKILQRLIGENIELTTVLDNRPITINADRTQMEQILMNLCINARDAIAGAGSLTIKTETVSLEEAYCADHVWANPGPYALMIVTDTGCGMDRATMNKVFEPFFTTKPVGKGTGLGLSTVYGIVKQNDGLINVYSEPGRGSTFKIYWPLVDRVPTSASTTPVMADLRGTETILLAEDDAEVRSFASRLLVKNGYRVLAARDGREAIDIFDAEGETIDLALLDVVMPQRSGREVMDHIRTGGSDIPVVFTSGYNLNAIHTEFVLHKGIELLEKPYGREKLLQRLRKELTADN